MTARRTPPTSLPEYLTRSRQAALRVIVDALPPGWDLPASYVAEHLTDEAAHHDLPPGVQGMFCLEAGGRIWVPRSFTRVVGGLIADERLPSGAPMATTAGAVHWLLVELHEELHGLGHRDVAVARTQIHAYTRYPHTVAAVEGTAHLAAEMFLARHARRTGVASLLPEGIEPRPNSIYQPQKGAMRVIAEFAADHLGGFPEGWSRNRRIDAVVARLVSDGIGDLAMARLHVDLAATAGVERLDPLRYDRYVGRIAASLDAALAEAQRLWYRRGTEADGAEVARRAVAEVERTLEEARYEVRSRTDFGGTWRRSVAELRRTPAPVLVVRETGLPARRRIVRAGLGG